MNSVVTVQTFPDMNDRSVVDDFDRFLDPSFSGTAGNLIAVHLLRLEDYQHEEVSACLDQRRTLPICLQYIDQAYSDNSQSSIKSKEAQYKLGLI